MFVRKILQIAISSFRFSAEYVHFVTFSPYEQAMVFENSMFSVEFYEQAIVLENSMFSVEFTIMFAV